jgi:dTDP-glucose 4,6-dehydratase
MKGLLVTGGAGFIGSNFVRHRLRQHADTRVVVLDALTYAGKLENLKAVWNEPAFRFVHGDIADQSLVEELLREEKLYTIVNFAAESHLDRSIHGADAFVYTNILGTHSLLKAARKVWLEERTAQTHRFHHVSTDEVYGSLGAHDPAFHEHMPYAPNSPYSASKAASDHLVRAYHQTYGLHVTIGSCSNNYGPHHLPEKLIPLAILNILRGRPVPIYGDGQNVRDWLHVSDHCRAIDLILQQGVPGERYNIGGNSASKNLALVQLICAIADETFRKERSLRSKFPHSPAAMGACTAALIKFVPDRPGHERRHVIDCGKIASDLGFRARVSLESGLRDTFDWYVQNDWWLQRVMDRSYQEWIREHYDAGVAMVEQEAEPLLLHRL